MRFSLYSGRLTRIEVVTAGAESLDGAPETLRIGGIANRITMGVLTLSLVMGRLSGYGRGIPESLGEVNPRAYAPLFTGFSGVFMENTRYSYCVT